MWTLAEITSFVDRELNNYGFFVKMGLPSFESLMPLSSGSSLIRIENDKSVQASRDNCHFFCEAITVENEYRNRQSLIEQILQTLDPKDFSVLTSLYIDRTSKSKVCRNFGITNLDIISSKLRFAAKYPAIDFEDDDVSNAVNQLKGEEESSKAAVEPINVAVQSVKNELKSGKYSSILTAIPAVSKSHPNQWFTQGFVMDRKGYRILNTLSLAIVLILDPSISVEDRNLFISQNATDYKKRYFHELENWVKTHEVFA